ncbi:MAG: hypothetical protein EAX96_13890 [Candidatus Lokiarchaeota archaeon]|nr:hypothetical protein [Candidatus Lokiarchaeota archaeon]
MKNSEIISEEEYNKRIKKISTRLSKPLFEQNKKFIFLDQDHPVENDESEVVYIIPKKATEKDLDESVLQKKIDKELRLEELETIKSIEEREKKLKKIKKTRKKSNFLVIVENQALLSNIEKFLQNKQLSEKEQLRIIKDISFVQNKLRQVESSAAKIEKGINSGSIQIIEFNEYKELKSKLANISPLAWLGPKKEPIKKEDLIDLKKILLKKQFRLTCLYCMDYSAIFTIASVDEKPKCLKCQSRYLGVTNIDDEKMKETLNLIKQKKSLSKDKKNIWKRIQKSATEMLDYGKIALIAMAANGIGTINTQRILQKTYDRKGEDEIFKIILEMRR